MNLLGGLDMSAIIFIVHIIKLFQHATEKFIMTHNHANVIRNFMMFMKTLDTKSFMKNMLLCFCAPTINGIKAASLINFRRHDEDMCSVWREHADEWLAPLNVQGLLLNEHGQHKNALVMIYRRELLAQALGCDEACSLLAEFGYPLHDVDACLECLQGKFCSGFPHEIGLFLDYPAEDVRGFIENRTAKKLSCPCCWKVYGDVRKAAEKFRQYKQAECEAARMILAGEYV